MLNGRSICRWFLLGLWCLQLGALAAVNHAAIELATPVAGGLRMQTLSVSPELRLQAEMARAHQALFRMAHGEPVSPTYLEQRSVTLATLKDYTKRAQEFIAFASHLGLNWVQDEQFDQIFCLFLDKLYFNGRPAADAEKALASVKFFVPRFRRLGAGHLPRSQHLITTLGNLRPGRQRVPLPWTAVCAVIGIFLSKNLVSMAVSIIVSFWAYLRPGENDRLKVKSLGMPPEGVNQTYRYWTLNLNPAGDLVPGKTVIFDRTVVLDNLSWMHDFFLILIRGRPWDADLWPHSISRLISEFSIAAEMLGLHVLRACRYGLRHGGASEDLVGQRRTHSFHFISA